MVKDSVRESSLENYCVRKTSSYGGIALKLNSSSSRGLPDRLLLFQGGSIGFLELKAYGKKLSSIQEFWITRLTCFGFIAGVADSKTTVDCFIQRILKEDVSQIS